jgi:hypothetical protein
MSEIKVDKVSPQSGTSFTLGDSGDTFTVPSGATLDLSNATVSYPAGTNFSTDWQTVKTGNFNATANEGYFVNTTSTAITATLPGSPSLGDTISFIDYAGTFDSNNLTVGRNGKNINGTAADLTVSVERAGFSLVFVDDTQGWLLKDK